MIPLKKFSLQIIVFITGGCVLILEVLAARILSPYFGNTIFTFSSVISVVLAALSVGYYLGGKIADRHPKEAWFYNIIFLGGISVFFIFGIKQFLLPSFGYSFSLVWGPLVSALILFFLPSFLLGILSPFAIKLAHGRFPHKGPGSISGEIFFWSTLGSIAGSISAGFYLIPSFGINAILLGTGILLSLVGLLARGAHGTRKKFFAKIIFLLVLIFFLLFTLALLKKNKNILYSRDGVYEKITVFDEEYKGKKTRFFIQDRSSSGAMFLDSRELVFDYTKYYELYKIFTPQPSRALVIGGGAYSIPKALLEDLPSAEIDVVEIEPGLLELGKKYFQVEENPRLKNFTADGRKFLEDSQKNYDLIFSDVYYSLFSIPTHFTTREFFKLAKKRLSPNGIFIANVIGSLTREPPSFLFSEMRTFQAVFPNSYFFAADSPQSLHIQNIIFVGYNSDTTINVSDTDLKKYESETLKNLGTKVIDAQRFALAMYPEFTDNFAPVEYSISKILKIDFNGLQNAPSGKEMLALVNQQLQYGPRYPTSAGHKKIQNLLLAEMKTYADEAHMQKWTHAAQDGSSYALANIIGRFSPEKEKRVILGAHYDSKRYAERDRKNPQSPVPGANDSASGTAVFLELARILLHEAKKLRVGIDIVFFDGEEGEIQMREYNERWYAQGSRYFIEHLGAFYPKEKPILGIIADMVCDRDLKIFPERDSLEHARKETEQFWNTARTVSELAFSAETQNGIRDDHTELNSAGIPSFLLIDFDYPYFHTTQDTPDKCDGKSLETVALAILQYLRTYYSL